MTAKKKEMSLHLISHSQILYFWPVWLSAFIFGGISLQSNTHVTLQIKTGEILVCIAPYPWMGLVFLGILVFNILFTSVNIRGLWASLVILVLTSVALLLHIFELWTVIQDFLLKLRMFISAEFYLGVGIVLFSFWFLVVFVYDRRRYIELHSTHLAIVQEVGEGEKNFDVRGIVFDKKRNNFFQHIVLGFGSGDIVITTSGGQRELIYFPNVLYISSKLKAIRQVAR
jgi:hypothetical protein